MTKIRFFLSIFLFANSLFLEAIPSVDLYQARISPICHPISLSMLEKEQKCISTYIQFVHAQDAQFLAYQVILKELYTYLYGDIFKEFEFLRPYHEMSSIETLEALFLRFPFLLSPKLEGNDASLGVSTHILSANLTLEAAVPDESAQDVFLKGKGVNHSLTPEILTSFLLDAFRQEGIFFDQLSTLIHEWIALAPKSAYGILNQIFISREMLSQCVYISSEKGGLKKKETEVMIFTINDYQRRRDSETFDCMENMQVRVLTSALKPGKVKIYRYSLIDPQQENIYIEHIRAQLKKVLQAKGVVQASRVSSVL